MSDLITPTHSESLEKLASLLATEDLIVEHADVPTASFDLKTRKVVLPLWKQMTKTLYHMLVLHEISHAINTPWDEFKEVVDENDADFKDYVNVIEDARIERKIKIKYPGSRRDFTEGYNDLHKRDFFGCVSRDPNSLNLIDRINLFYKLGTRIDVQFTEEELELVDAVDKTVTFKDVLDLAEKIYGFAKEQAETAEQHNLDESSFNQSSDDDDFDDDEYEEGDGDEYDNEDGASSKVYDHEGGSSDLSASTFDEFERNMSQKLIDEDSKVNQYFEIDLTNLDYNEVVVSHKELMKIYSTHLRRTGCMENRLTLWNWFLKKNKNSVNYLVKEFEMKKAADMYARAKSDKTGKVDPNKLYNYKFSEDIFLRNTVLPGSKNHGLMMLVDLSGSMHDNIFGSMQQLVNLVMFCRRVGIAHRVYGFSDCWNRTVESFYRSNLEEIPKQNLPRRDTNGFEGGSEFHLLEFFNEKMNNQTFTFMAQRLLEAGWSNNDYWTSFRPPELSTLHIPHDLVIRLGGTPLNLALTYMRNMIRDFRKETNSQIVNLVCITDGGSNSMSPAIYNGIARDKETKLQCEFSKYSSQTGFLLSILKKTCNVHAVNFFISGGRPWTLYRESQETNKIYRKNKSITTHNWMGFDDVHTIWGGKKLHGQEVSMDDAKQVKKGALARTMIKMGNNRRSSRIILSKFIDRIAA